MNAFSVTSFSTAVLFPGPPASVAVRCRPAYDRKTANNEAGTAKECDMASVPFDKLDGYIWMNGEFVKWADAKIHVLTHGLHLSLIHI